MLKRIEFKQSFRAALLSTVAIYIFPIDQASQMQGAILRGRITEDLRQTGVSAARITITSGSAHPPTLARTDDKGEFTAAVADAPTYRLRIERSGFSVRLMETKGENRQTVDLGDVVLSTDRHISGSATFTDGEPVEGLSVIALPVRRGGVRWKPGGEGSPLFTMTDDAGNFLLEHVPAGRFLLYAYSTTRQVPVTVARVPLPMYYPGPDSAGIDMRDTAAVTGISLVFQTPAQTTTVEGIVRPSNSLPGGTLATVALGIPGAPVYFVSTAASVGEPFRIFGVPAGQYNLLAAISDKSGVRRVLQPISVVGSVSAVDVTFPEKTTFRGVLDMGEPPAGGTGRSSPLPPGLSVGCKYEKLFTTISSPVQADGTFEINADTTGDSCHVVIASPLTPGTYVSSIHQGDKDLLAGSLAAENGAGPVRITLRNDGGTISGTVMQYQAAQGSIIVLAPKKRDASYLYRTVRLRPDGHFLFSDVAPGLYDAFAFPLRADMDSEDYASEEFLSAYDLQPTAVAVDPGGAVSIQLRTIAIAK